VTKRGRGGKGSSADKNKHEKLRETNVWIARGREEEEEVCA